MMQIEKCYLSTNPYSRPGMKRGCIQEIVIHWVGNPGSSAQANRNYFEGLKVGKRYANGELIYASSHYVVGLLGEIIQCIPDEEIAYHSGKANATSLGIEVCHLDEEGEFGVCTMRGLVKLCADLCKQYKLNPQTALERHYDQTGKCCPKYYVNHPAAWEQLKKEVERVLKESSKGPLDETIERIEIGLNKQWKTVQAVKIEGAYFVKLRDLSDEQIEVSYDPVTRRPSLEVRYR